MPTSTVSRTAVRRWYWEMNRHYCNGSVVVQPLGNWANSLTESYRKHKVWVRTPNYRVLRAQGKHLPDNQFSVEESRICDEEFILHYNEPVGTCTGNPLTESHRIYDDHLQTVYLPWSRGTQVLTDSSLRAKMIDRAKGAEWSIPVFFGEARESVGMVLNAARTVGSAYRNLRRGNFSGALVNLGIQGDDRARRRYNSRYGTDPTGAAASAWLSLTYGWVPLLNDAKNAAETLAQASLHEGNREIRVTANTRLDRVEITPDVLVAASPQIIVRRTLIIGESFKGVWRCKPTNWAIAGSLGLTNPALVAWELLPLSFVADWFLPIGRYLEGLDVPLRYTHLGGSIGYRRQVETLYDTWKYYGQSTGGGAYRTTHVELTRVPLSGPPTVGLDSIIFEPNLGAGRVMSAISLLRQTFS
jgi:hypothetical protein